MPEGFARIITELEQRKTAIDRALVALREVEGVAAPGTTAPTAAAMPGTPARKGAKRSAAMPEPPRPKRKISPEGMKRIIAATKKRWALKRAEAKAIL